VGADRGVGVGVVSSGFPSRLYLEPSCGGELRRTAAQCREKESVIELAIRLLVIGLACLVRARRSILCRRSQSDRRYPEWRRSSGTRLHV